MNSAGCWGLTCQLKSLNWGEGYQQTVVWEDKSGLTRNILPGRQGYGSTGSLQQSPGVKPLKMFPVFDFQIAWNWDFQLPNFGPLNLCSFHRNVKNQTILRPLIISFLFNPVKNVLHEVDPRFQRNLNPFSTNVVLVHPLEKSETGSFLMI